MPIRTTYIIAVYLFLLKGPAIEVTAQNNQGIFKGGQGDGFDEEVLFITYANAIFKGSNGDGFDESIFTLPTNNAIFIGGSGDGFDENVYQPINSNFIFAGGSGDGFDENQFTSISNNNIYSGGPGDGFDELLAFRAANNIIFAGGQGDGFDETVLSLQINNSIFAGGTGDGFDEQQFTFECSVITWTGDSDTSWDNPSNWNLARVPYPCDLVIIPSAPNDAVISNGPLGIDFLDEVISRGAKKLIIEEGGRLVLTGDALIQIQNEMRVAGTLVSIDNVSTTVLQAHPGGLVTIKATGEIMLNQ